MSKTLWVLLATQIISGIGEFISLTGLVYFVSEQTGSSLAVAGVYTLQAVAIFVVAPFTGAMADRREARAVALFFNWFLTFWTLGYLVVYWFLPKAVSLPTIAVMVALATWPQMLINPSYKRMFQQLTSSPEVNRNKAVAWQSISTQIYRVLGLVVGAGFATQLGGVVFLVDSATYLIANLILLFGLRVLVPPVARVQTSSGLGQVFRDIWEGLRYAWLEPGYIGLFLIWLAGFIFWGVKDVLAPEFLVSVGFARGDFGVYTAVATVAEFMVASVIVWRGFNLTKTTMIVAAFGFGLTALATGVFAVPVALYPLKFLEGVFGNLLGQTAYKVLVLDQDSAVTGRLGNLAEGMGKLTIAAAGFGIGFYADSFGEANAFTLTGLLVLMVSTVGLVANRGLNRTR